eukprot:4891665-Pyramimonas_sp.AAC.1
MPHANINAGVMWFHAKYSAQGGAARAYVQSDIAPSITAAVERSRGAWMRLSWHSSGTFTLSDVSRFHLFSVSISRVDAGEGQ